MANGSNVRNPTFVKVRKSTFMYLVRAVAPRVLDERKAERPARPRRHHHLPALERPAPSRKVTIKVTISRVKSLLKSLLAEGPARPRHHHHLPALERPIYREFGGLRDHICTT